MVCQAQLEAGEKLALCQYAYDALHRDFRQAVQYEFGESTEVGFNAVEGGVGNVDAAQDCELGKMLAYDGKYRRILLKNTGGDPSIIRSG